MVFCGLVLDGAAAGIKEIRDRDTLQETERSFFFFFFLPQPAPVWVCLCVCPRLRYVEYFRPLPPELSFQHIDQSCRNAARHRRDGASRVPLITNSRVGEASHTRAHPTKSVFYCRREAPRQTGGTEAEQQKYLFDWGRCCRCHCFIAVFLALHVLPFYCNALTLRIFGLTVQVTVSLFTIRVSASTKDETSSSKM